MSGGGEATAAGRGPAPPRLLTAVPSRGSLPAPDARTSRGPNASDEGVTPPRGGPADGLLARWDAQQAAYIADREGRFAVVLDVVAFVLGEAPVVVDVACGPGSLSVRVLERFPDAQVVALDVDPLLLRVAGEALAPFGDRAAVLDADLDDPQWPDAVRAALATHPKDDTGARAPVPGATGDAGASLHPGGITPTAVVSSTALHWLPPAGLVRVYGQAHDLLAPGGVLLNADHLRFDDRLPTLRRISAVHDEATQARGFGDGAPTWDAWWAEARALPGGEELHAERERRFAGRDAPPPTTVDFHVAALGQAGFAEASPVWQLFDDFVVLGRRG